MKRALIIISILAVLEIAALAFLLFVGIGPQTVPDDADVESLVASDAHRAGQIAPAGADPFAWYKDDRTIQSIITVQQTQGSKAKVCLYTKGAGTAAATDPAVKVPEGWTLALSCDALIGADGAGAASISKALTPVGDFGVTTAFGIKDNPGTKLPYLKATDSLWCCGEAGPNFNRFINLSETPHDCTGEHIIEFAPYYNYGFLFDYNKEQVYEKGFAFFFHCTGTRVDTGGCIAVDEANMVTILKAIDAKTRLIITAAATTQAA